KEDVELSKITDREDIELINQLMGVEACDTGDDECLKRRIVSEAHLDYIYTQHHKP
ncbi:Phytosulfokine - like 6, partial [Theobroma cacao]